ncbi:ABC transporter substrate-binding protein [Bacillus testis]|uniref:ABC transporter substrate-binding protein n=1 Tax=Bacillus testis TaxID=1622072 RepID=UPI00067F1974|nr:iron-siderophore ABC transporter substrate-binding protein [Bacillus testis]
MKKNIQIVLSVFFLIALLALTGCGKEKNEENAAGEKSYTVEHAMGKTKIVGEPKKIVVLTNEGTEALLSLGIKPVGAVQSWVGNPWYDHIKDDMKDAEVVGVEHEVNLEKIASLKPDLIIGNKIRQEAVYDKLSKIAPTVFAETLRGDWKENFALYAKAVNKEEQGKKVLSDYEEKVVNVKEALGDKVNQEISMVRFMTGITRIYYTDSFSGVIFEELGFKRAPQQEKLFKEDNKLGKLAIEVGKEVIPEMDADTLFYFTYTPEGDNKALETEKEWINDPLWKNLNAVKNNRAYKVDDIIWNTAGGVLAANLMLDEIKELFAKQN